MNIILVVKGLGLGGAEKHVVDLAIALKKRGCDVSVLYFIRSQSELVGDLTKHDVECLCLDGGVWWLSVIPNAIKFLINKKPTVVHAHLPVPAVIFRLLKLVFRYRLIYTEHNVIDRLHPITKAAHKASRFLDDSAVSCSKAVADSLPWNSVVVDNGISVPESLEKKPITNLLRSRLSIEKDSVLFVCIANLWPKKNHKLLIGAFDNAFRNLENANVDLVLVGQDGTERESLEQFAKTLDMSSRVHFMGPYPNASELLPDADVFCLSSFYEGLPIALLESMAVGLPAIVTDVGGMGSAVVDGESGFVVSSADSSGYEKALQKLFLDPALRASMGAKAHSLAVAKYSQNRMVESLIGEYLPAEG
ncbi:glycosyltransferase family 4 protein [Marinobacter sp. SBS5]|uniref:glycosyltransferase family 4 protein n=1 Tax=Marinobacter sp. SBS5 TaxID=3401754 RepID=UPI003AAF0233